MGEPEAFRKRGDCKSAPGNTGLCAGTRGSPGARFNGAVDTGAVTDAESPHARTNDVENDQPCRQIVVE